VLKSIRLKNFKLHEDTSIEAAPITVFIGPNNSGKSSIFQALLALRQAAARGGNEFLQSVVRRPTTDDQPYLFPPGHLLELGDYPSVLRQGSDCVEITLSGTYDPHKSPKYEPPTELQLELRVKDNILIYNYGTLSNSYAQLGWGWLLGKGAVPLSREISLDEIVIFFQPLGTFGVLAASGFQGRPGGTAVIAPERIVEAVELQKFIASTPSRFMNSFIPVFPLRGVEEWGYPLPEKRPDGLSRLSSVDRSVAMAGLLAYDRDLEDRVSNQLSRLLNIRIKVRLIEGKRITIWAESSDKRRTDTPFVNEGTGASQLPYILVPITLANPGDTILLSEPEAHLHPKGQCELTRMLLTVARKENIQFFIETHSEHVLHSLLHAVAKADLTPDELAIYYFLNEKGVAKVRRLKIDNTGGVEGGLPGFFDQSLDELSEYLDALKGIKT
jgi:energy-coupling factor transporter ATP-binding protein EcfA2